MSKPEFMMQPANKAVSVTAHDSTNIATGVTRGLLVKTAGDYVLLLGGDSATVTINLAAGVVHPLRVKRVNSTGSAATTGIVGFY
jgi:hypothetical protein